MDAETVALLELYGWEIECHSPFEIRHQDGSFATKQAANMVVSVLREEYAEGVEP